MSFGQFNTIANTQQAFSTHTSFQGSSASIVAPDQHHLQAQARPTANRRGQPNQKRQPHGGAKSHKLLDQASFQNLFVARLPRSFDNDDLLALFAEFTPTSAVVMMDMTTGKSKGFGFVTFKTEQEGKMAADAMSARTFTLPQQTTTTTTTTSQAIEDSSAQRFTLEIKASTFNGQRIVIESRYVYFRNFPAQLFEEEDGFARIRAFLGHYGTVENIEFHGGNTSPNFQAPLLVTFATQAEAAVAIHECHSKVLFPQLSETPVMAKYADMTTMKVMDRQNRRQSQSQSIPGSRNRSANNTPSPQSHDLSPANSGEILPFPALARRVVSSTTGGSWSSGNVSPAAGSFAAQQGGGSALALESVCTAASGPFPQLASNRMSFGSNASSRGRSSSVSGRGARRGSTTYFRNDPYNRDGYVVLSSSTSQSSRLSTRTISSDADSFEYSVGTCK